MISECKTINAHVHLVVNLVLGQNYANCCPPVQWLSHPRANENHAMSDQTSREYKFPRFSY